MSDNHPQAPTPPTPPNRGELLTNVAAGPSANAAGAATPAAPVAPAPRKVVHPIGWIALSAAVLGFLFACIPGALIIGWILLPIAFILAIVAIAVKGKKWPGVVALILSIIGTIVGVAVFFAAAANAVHAAIDKVTDTTVSAPTDDPAATKSAEPAKEPAGTSRDNPAPIGSVASGKDWEVTINSVTLGATDQVLKENTFNEKPEAGYEYILINVTAKYIGEDKQMAAFTQVEYVTPDGVTIDGLKSLAVAPNKLDTLSELYKGASVTGNIALSVPSATAGDGVLAVQPGMLADEVYVAVK